MSAFPGPRPITGDRVELAADTMTATFTGTITVRGILRDGQGFAELTLPTAEPQQWRDLEHATRHWYTLYREGGELYRSPMLTLVSLHGGADGAIVLTGKP
ncbi:hypothetical protein [Streptomyces sp. NPDC046985]|uniref:hypothetical protein n=1 Tax=Streptomyces sp. NPDC046985 TaxID=3155377 RepID=UPI0033F38AB9